VRIEPGHCAGRGCQVRLVSPGISHLTVTGDVLTVRCERRHGRGSMLVQQQIPERAGDRLLEAIRKMAR
jgi:hypothetical protein